MPACAVSCRSITSACFASARKQTPELHRRRDQTHHSLRTIQGALQAQVSNLVSQNSSALESSSQADVRWWPLFLGGALVLALCLEVFTAGLRLRDFLTKDAGGLARQGTDRHPRN